jgi:putative ABC transport system permease protein
MAAAYGALTVLAFSLWSLGQAREVSPGILFRSAIAPPTQRPHGAYIVATVAVAAALAALAILTADNRPLAAIFVVSVMAAFLMFQALSGLATRAAAAASRSGIERATLRFALANLHRPGAPVARIILSLGLGATVLVAIALIQGNLTREVREQLPDQAPSYFFIDILPHQVKDFEDAVATVPGAKGLTRVPMLRGRIARIDGMTVDEAVQRGRIQPEVRWAVDNERGLTYAATPPAGSEVVAGQWWPADYKGEPLISFDAQLAQGMGLKVGDTIAVNVLGREITGRIANLRRIHWRSLNVNFTIVFSPGVLERAPHSHIASVNVPEAAETRLVATVTDKLPNVSAIRVRDALETAGQVFEQIGFAVRITALVTIAAGLLVLAGAVAAGHRRRIYDAVVFKVLGATRRKILGAFLLEYGLLGLVSALLAAGFGSLVAYVILEQAMRIGWSFLPAAAFGTALVAAVTAIGFGFVGVWRAMGQKPAPLLRNE